MRIHSIRVKNFKALQNVEMPNIPGFAVLVGANGTGKSTFIDVFGFLKDCLKNNVRAALQRRGGFAQVVSRGCEGQAIEIELQIEMDIAAIQKSRLVTYRIEIVETDRKVSVRKETLRFKRAEYGAPFHFLRFEDGAGAAIPEVFDAFDKDVPLEDLEREQQTLAEPYILRSRGLGSSSGSTLQGSLAL
jgi:predicted ATPase